MALLSSLLANTRLGLVTGERVAPRPAMQGGREAFPFPAPGHCHDWHLVEAGGVGKRWHPPLTLLAGLALRSGEAGRIVWIGRSCWPTFQHVCSADASRVGVLERCLFLDPLSDRERFWAIAEALRCPAVRCVVADGSGMSATTSRRLQLAAESGSAVGLLARPGWELEEPSSAATRWRVTPRRAPASGTVMASPEMVGKMGGQKGASKQMGPGWEVELQCCRGRHVGQDAPRRWIVDWTYQVIRGKGALDFSADVGCGSVAAASGASRPERAWA